MKICSAITTILLLSFAPIAIGQSVEPQIKKQKDQLCKFYKESAEKALAADGIQVGVVVDQGMDKTKSMRELKLFFIPAASKPLVTIYDLLANYGDTMDAKVCDLELGYGLCALIGIPKKAKAYNCEKELCFDPKYWAIFVMRGKWQLPWDKGIKDFQLKDGDVVGFTYLDKNNYPSSKDDASKFPFPFLSSDDCANMEASK